MEHMMEWTRLGVSADGYCTYSLKGDCDLYNAPEFLKDMTKALSSELCKIEFDCAGLTYLDSTGVGAIIKILQLAKRNIAQVRFKGLTGAPRKVLEMCNVIRIMREERTSGES